MTLKSNAGNKRLELPLKGDAGSTELELLLKEESKEQRDRAATQGTGQGAQSWSCNSRDRAGNTELEL